MNFPDYVAENRKQLRTRADDIRRELELIKVELAAIAAYEESRGGRGHYPYGPDGTISVPQAGREFLGLSESGSWQAARRGDIPTVKINRYRRVPVAEMRRKLEDPRARPGGRPRSKVREEEGYPGSLVPAQ